MVEIKNFEMPHNCYDCDLHNYFECDITNESIEEDYCWNGDSREKHCPLREVEAIPKADYENRLKTDLVAMLEKLQLEIKELWDSRYDVWLDTQYYIGKSDTLEEVDEVIQQKIDALKEQTDGKA